MIWREINEISQDFFSEKWVGNVIWFHNLLPWFEQQSCFSPNNTIRQLAVRTCFHVFFFDPVQVTRSEHFLVLLVEWPLNSFVSPRRSIRIQKGVLADRDKCMRVLSELIGAVCSFLVQYCNLLTSVIGHGSSRSYKFGYVLCALDLRFHYIVLHSCDARQGAYYWCGIYSAFHINILHSSLCLNLSRP